MTYILRKYNHLHSQYQTETLLEQFLDQFLY
jgi:hypothetical protein